MCGITGFINYKSSELNIRNTIQKMTYSIEHRGPDNIGSWLDSNDGIALGHSRLSIIDLSANGNQPMVSKCSRYVIVYNGELYNNNKLRHELEISIDGKNTKWNSHSDTETIIECISFYGVEKTLMKINGMFAMAVWDKKEKKLFLGRDRIGEKPLYYGWGNGVFIFGSELKSLKENSMFSLEIDRNALSQYMRLSYVPTPLSIYKNCNKLSPGSFLTIHLEGANENDYKISKYWELSIENNYKSYDDVNFEEKVINQLETSIQSQMVSDVPIGAFLSGGIDSTLVVALMQKNSLNPINTFTIGYDYQNLNEANYAKEIANYLGTNHTEQYVTKRDALGVIPNLSHIYDEPFGDSSQIPTTLVSVLAKDKVKVVLTGDGADELFAGYPRYILTHRLWRVLNNIPMGIRESFSSMLNCYPYELLNKIFTLFFSRDLLTKSKKIKYLTC
ncbi:MAG: asparagine synthase (glutamine-hydrolyzing) [Rhodopirellula sp.]|nr:asparagine synthase (glutamine-hydrolyzing) [Rhodopirellula sp.]